MASSSQSDKVVYDEAKLEAEWKADPEAAFDLGVEIAFSRWEVLTLAVNNWAGSQGQDKVDDFIDACVDWFLDEKDKLHWDEVSDWLAEVLLNDFHTDAQDGSCDWMGRLLCQLYLDVMTKQDFAGLKKMIRSKNEIDKAMKRARQLGDAESKTYQQKYEEQQIQDEDDDGDDISEGEENDEAKQHDDNDQKLDSLDINASSSSSSAAEPVEEKTAEQLQDEADGWETVPKRGKGKGRR